MADRNLGTHLPKAQPTQRHRAGIGTRDRGLQAPSPASVVRDAAVTIAIQHVPAALALAGLNDGRGHDPERRRHTRLRAIVHPRPVERGLCGKSWDAHAVLLVAFSGRSIEATAS